MEREPAVMSCMEVWGGNQPVDAGVIMAGLDAWVYSKPFGESDSGGDVYYVSSCATGRITRLLVADVAGHGAGVSQLAVALRALMRKYINQIEQTRFVRSMNERFAEMSSAGVFATAIVTTFFAPTRQLSLCNAGHPAPLWYRSDTRQWRLLSAHDEIASPANIPLGILDLADYQQFDVTLGVGDLIMCYTDSLIEARDEAGQMLGPHGLLKMASELGGDAGEDLVRRLLDRIAKRCEGNLCADDVTVMVFRPNGLGQRVRLKDKLLAPLRVMKGVALSIGRGDAPWPEISVANIGGAMLGAFSKARKKKVEQ